MNTAAFLQICLILGVFIPLASFVFLTFFGTKLGRAAAKPTAGKHGGHAHGHDHGHDHAAGHDDHGHAAGPAPGEPRAGWVATGAIGLSLVLALVVLVVWTGLKPDARADFTRQAAQDAVVWTEFGVGATAIPVQFGVKLDSLTVIMFLMVTICATCIHVFSIGYMRGDPRFARFFTYLSLFCFSMLGLVISSNLLFMFVFWELVGVCSYFLIGFWFEKKSASNAAIKAFVVNRIGDLGFMIGLALCFIYLGDLSLDGAAAVFEAGAHAAGWTAHDPAAHDLAAPVVAQASKLFTTLFWGVPLATWLGLGLFCGAIGKSAQFPLHVWLPDAMEGPTPVSALIHAATMVAAGVYLVARVFLLLTPGAQMAIAVIGCITLTMAALIAIVQVDIKRVLAYSTLSQLGYMIFAMGIGAWIAALFHLLTHAFFKALLFLGSGQVIAGCHHEQDMRKMGGLWNKMPRTTACFAIAVLAISSVGIPWSTVGIGGFYSKDEILAVAYYRHFEWLPEPAVELPEPLGSRQPSFMLVAENSGPGALSEAAGEGGSAEEPGIAGEYPGTKPLPFVLFLLPVIIAYVTPFYMGRCFVLTFLGKPRDEKIHAHAHETPLMYGPLLVLAAMTLISGWFLFRGLVADAVPSGGNPALVPVISGLDNRLEVTHHALPLWVGASWILGLLSAYLLYRNGLAAAERVRGRPVVRPAYNVLWNKFYFDEVYGFLFVGGVKTLAVISRLWDQWIIDGLVNTLAHVTERLSRFSGVVLDQIGVDGLVNLVGRVCHGLAAVFRSVQTGVVRNYVLLTALAVAGILISFWDKTIALVLVALAVGTLVLPANGRRRRVAGEGRL